MRGIVKRSALALGMALAASTALPVVYDAPAYAQSSSIVREIQINGAHRIERETVLSYLAIQPGDTVNRSRIAASLKSLYATGLFADVNIRREGARLVVDLVENPIINEVVFEGNDVLTDKVLKAETELAPRMVYSRTRVQNDVQRLTQMFRRLGRFAATVEPKVIQLADNRVNLVYEISEGDVTYITRILFVGNKAYSDDKLHDALASKEDAWWRFLSNASTFDPDRLLFDEEQLRRFYLRNGYADFRVRSSVAELTPDRKGLFLTFTIDEGVKYKFGKVDIETSFKALKVETLRPALRTDRGDRYNADKIESSITGMTNILGEKGYAFVDIEPVTNRHPEKRIIDLTYQIDRGPRVYVERIDIEGNVRTLDKVVRREFLVAEGDAFNAAKLRRSRSRIQGLGFFRNVEMVNEQGSAPDKARIKVKVEEQSTGSINLGIGFSSVDNVQLTASVSERNILGQGIALRASVKASESSKLGDFSVTDPYFMGQDLSTSVKLYNSLTDRQSSSSYDEAHLGSRVSMGYPVTEYLRHSVNYTLDRETIGDIGGSASQHIAAEEGKRIRSILGSNLDYSDLDDPDLPTDGYTWGLSGSVAGLGGDVRYLKGVADYTYYYPLLEKFTAVMRGRAGHIEGIDQDVHITDLFHLGGHSMRGFDSYGIGPRDKSTDDALGGKTMGMQTFELRWDNFFSDDYDIHVRVFTDIGTVIGIDQTDNVYDDTALRGAAGLGFTWQSTMGPINVDFSNPFAKKSYDKTETVRFNFGTSF